MRSGMSYFLEYGGRISDIRVSGVIQLPKLLGDRFNQFTCHVT